MVSDIMAGIAFDSILSSKPNRFLVGPQKREFFIHASLVASKSPTLHSIVNGSTEEATSGCIVREDVDEETFVRFGQYVYTGDYEGNSPFEPLPVESRPNESSEDIFRSAPVEPVAAADAVPELAPDEPISEPVPDEPTPATDEWGFSTTRSRHLGSWGLTAARATTAKEDDWFKAGEVADFELPLSSKKKDKKKKRRVLELERLPEPAVEFVSTVRAQLPTNDAWKSFTTGLHYEPGTAGPYSVYINEDSSLEYREVFLSHARVHMMAEHYDIQPLAQLALHKLHQILCHFILHEERVCDVVALLRYCYGEDERPRLRELVSAFAACHLKHLWVSREFREVFGAYGELSLAIVGNIIDRLD